MPETKFLMGMNNSIWHSKAVVIFMFDIGNAESFYGTNIEEPSGIKFWLEELSIMNRTTQIVKILVGNNKNFTR